MHKIDENITVEYLLAVNFNLEAAVEALAPSRKVSEVGISEFCNWSNTREGAKYWRKQYNNGLDGKARTVISDMILVAMCLSVEEAAVIFAKEKKH